MAQYLDKTGLTTLVQQIDNKYASKTTVPLAYQPKITAGTGLAFAGNTLNITLDTTLYQVVESLPEEGQNPNKIYLILGQAGEQNTYTEYLWVNDKWEKLGEYKAAIDLTPYLKKTEAENTYAKVSHTHTFSQITDKVPVAKLPIATATAVGAVKGGSTSGKNYGVTVAADGAMTVNVPWTDTDTKYTAGDGLTLQGTEFNHAAYTAKASGLYKVTVDAMGHVSAATAVAKTDITALGIPAQDTTYSAAVSGGASGLMTGADKAKLDAIEAGANKYVLPTASATVLGGIKIGSGLAIDEGVVSVDAESVEAGSVQWANVQGKPSVFATNLANISDLQANWDAILKAAPTAFVDAITNTEINALFE